MMSFPSFFVFVVLIAFIQWPAMAGDILFQDSFETGLEQPGVVTDNFESADMSTTNDAGFSWSANNKTSIVTQHPIDGPVAVYNNGSIYNIANPIMGDGTLRDWSAFAGDYSLRFRYPANQSWSEQRFDLGSAYPEIWVRFWLRVPQNFEHNTGNTNNKLFAIWMDGYEFGGLGPTIVWQYRNDGSNGSTTMFYKLQNTGALNNDNGQRHSGELQTQPFISFPDDQGRWMQLAFHVKASSSAASSDGVVQMYRRWDGESNFTLIHEDLNVELLHAPPAGPVGFRRGYLMGWANAAYENDTEWLLDDFTVSAEPLIRLP